MLFVPSGAAALGIDRRLPPLLPVICWGNTVDGIGANALSGYLRLRHAGWVTPSGDIVDCLHQYAAIRHDGDIGGAQVFAATILDRAHALTRPLVVYVDITLTHAKIRARQLLLLIEAPVVVPPRIGDVIRQADPLQTLCTHGLFVDRSIKAGEDRIPIGVGVIDGYVHLGNRHGL